jgi:beta-galactosidase
MLKSLKYMMFQLQFLVKFTRLLLSLFLAACGITAAFGGEYGSVFVPLPSSVPMSPELLWKNNPAVLSLSGRWEFKLIHGMLVDGTFVLPTETTSLVTTSSYLRQAPGIWFYPKKRGWRASEAKFSKFPQWWQINLGAEQEVKGLNLQFEDPSFVYRILVEGSLDGKKWNPLADLRQSDVRDGSVALTPASSRYLRITFTDAKNDKGVTQGAVLNSVTVMVMRDGAEVSWKPEFPQSDDGFAAPSFDASKWASMPVPGNWEVEGFSKPTYHLPDDAAGLYRRWIEVPASFANKRVLWHFDGVSFGAELWVNGKKAGWHVGSFNAWYVDITDLVKPGQRNLLALRVCKSTDESRFDSGDFWALGGIQRETHLIALPKQHVEDIRLVTPLSDIYTNATLDASVTLRGIPKQKITITGRIHGADGKSLSLPVMTASGVVDMDGKIRLTLNQKVSAPRLWSAEKPNLYYLVVSCGKEQVQQRFGFRQVEIRDGVFLVNGTPVKLFGTCRHEEWGDVGHALDEKRWRTDVEMIKAGNFNAVRTSHYPPARRFLELCDERGLYVLDEVPACWTPNDHAVQKVTWVTRTEATWKRDKNFPCVIGWNIGNESGYGPNNLAAYKHIKKLDPTRVALISSTADVSMDSSLEIIDIHYPDLNFLERKATSNGKAQAVSVTEGPHIFSRPFALLYDWGIKDFWGEALYNQTETMWRLPGIFGGFIWEWQDQGLADRSPEKDAIDPVSSALVGTEADLGGAKPTAKEKISLNDNRLRGNNYKGMVDPFRTPNPEYFNAYRAYCPVMIKASEVTISEGAWSVPIENRYAFTDLSELKATWEGLVKGKVIAQGPLAVSVAPRSTTTLRIAPVAGADEVRLCFVHVDGRTVLATRLAIPSKVAVPPPAGLPSTSPVVLDQAKTDGNIKVRAAGCELDLDRKTGRIVAWRIGSETLLNSGPDLTLGEQRIYKGEGMRNFKGKPVPVVQSASPSSINASSVSAEQVDGKVRIKVIGTVSLVESPSPVADIEYTIEVRPNGSLGLAWKMTWKADLTDAWELGMRFSAPSTLNTLDWSRKAQWSEYPKNHLGAPTGSVKATDLRFRSSKRDIFWALFSGSGASGITVLQEGSQLHVRGLVERGKTVLCLCSEIAPPRDYSGNLQNSRIILLKPGEVVGGSFVLQPTKIESFTQSK